LSVTTDIATSGVVYPGTARRMRGPSVRTAALTLPE
jgi:hypothetical protein